MGHFGHADALMVHPDWTKRPQPQPKRRDHLPPVRVPSVVEYGRALDALAYESALRQLQRDYRLYWRQWEAERRALANSPPKEAP